jgi:predicted NUDIX family NTP pyrophosphohydrolase
MQEETGMLVSGNLIELSPVKQKSGKIVQAWAAEGNLDPATIKSNSFSLEWPPRSGQHQAFPEIDKAARFTITDAKTKINTGQCPLLEELNSYFSK